MTKGQKILADIKKDVPAKQPKVIKVATLIKVAIIVIVIAVSFGLGWKTNDLHDTQYTSEINNAIKAHDAQLK